MKKILFAAFLVAILLFGCINLGGGTPTNETNVTPTPPPPAPKPSFSITAPVSGDIVMSNDDATDVPVSLSTSNFVVKPAGTASKQGEGHFRMRLDDGADVDVEAKTYTFPSVAVGMHTIEVEIVNNDNTPYSPAIIRTVSFEVKKQEPQVYVPVNYTVDVQDFSYNPSSLTVKVGDSVTWVNNGKQPRSATCYIEGKEKFDTGVIGPGQSATVTFTETLSCEYYATTFRMMTGNITVESSG